MRDLPPLPTRARRQNHTRSVGLILATIVAILGLVAGTRWFIQQGLSFGPTPTVTATRKTATETPTVDFRATQNAVELATQRARDLAMIGVNTPTPVATETPTPTPTSTATLATVSDATPTPEITVVIMIPGLVVEPTYTPSVGGVTPTIEIPTTPAVDVVDPTLETPDPTATETPATSPTESATESPTATPTETPFSTPTPVPVVQPTVSLVAVTKNVTTLYAGPSTRYTQTIQIPGGQRVIMQGRTLSGEWIYLCCEQNQEGWTRLVNLDIRDNTLPVNAPVGANPNSARWLIERTPTVVPLTPIPEQTAIPADDYPLERRDRAAQAVVDQTFVAQWNPDWTNTNTNRAFSSPVIVAGQSVIVANEDLQLRSYDRERGNQRWSVSFGSVIRQAPAVLMNNGLLDIFVMDDSGRVTALREQGNSAVQLWSINLQTPAQSGINVAGDLIYVTGQNSRVYAIHRLTSAVVWDVATEGSDLQYPVVGDQLLYVGNQKLKALDLYTGQVVWESDPVLFTSVSSPPVYVYPGITALAEVYATDANGRIHAFDAATGQRLWTHTDTRRANFIAADQVRLYIVGNGFVKAVNRGDGSLAWDYSLGTDIVGGPIVGNGQLLFISTGGYIQILNSLQGTLISGASSAARVVIAPPAISGNRIFVPDASGILHALRKDN